MTDNKNTRPFSSQVVDGMERAPSRAMLHAVGFTTEDFKKPQNRRGFNMEHGYAVQYAHQQTSGRSGKRRK